MSVNWENSTCAAFKEASKYDEDSEEWREFATMRHALVMCLLVCQFPQKSDWAITDSNWKDVFRRVFIYERVDGSIRKTFNEETGEMLPDYFSADEVHSMVGLRVNAGNQSDTQFRDRMIKIVAEGANERIRQWEYANEEVS